MRPCSLYMYMSEEVLDLIHAFCCCYIHSVSRYGQRTLVAGKIPYAAQYGMPTLNVTIKEFIEHHMGGASRTSTSPSAPQ